MSNKFSEWSQNNPIIVIFIVIILALLSIIASYYVQARTECFLISCQLWHQALMVIGTSILSVLIFKTILTSNAVIKMIKKALEESFLEFSFLEGYNEDKLKVIAEKISSRSKYITLDFNEKKIKSIQNAKKEFLDNPNHKNFFIEDVTWIKTIYKNGNDIQNTIANLDIVNPGNIELKYILETDFPGHSYPLYEEFTNNRFNDYSFNVKITDYTRKGNNLQKDEYPRYTVTCTKQNKTKKTFKVIIENCLKDDKFTIRISRTTLGEYSPEKVKKRKEESPCISTVDMSQPAGVRTIIFQEEVYGDEAEGQFKSNITVNQKASHIHAKKEESSFYITKTWKVFYSDFPKAEIEFNIY